MDAGLKLLETEGLLRFHAIEPDAVSAVAERFYTTLPSVYAKFGPRGRDACREDLTFHLEFLKPVLEFGLVAPMVHYLRWLTRVLAARSIPAEHLVKSLDWLAEFFAARMEASDGATVTAALQVVRTRFLAADEALLLPVGDPEPVPAATEFQTALLAGGQREALAVVNGCLDSGLNLVDVERDVIQTAMYQIGEKWQANQVSVAQEHIATAIVQSVMTVALLRSTPPPPINKSVLLACVAGNHHTIGLRMVADSFQLSGWEIQYLGADVPTSSLIRQIGEWSPDLVGLSLSFAQQLRTVKDIIAQLSARFGPARPRVIIGGLVINRFDRLVDLVGADACGADARDAIGAANRLVNS